jgi:hypothetical protein
LSFGILSFGILSFGILSFGILSFGILSFGILSFEILSFNILPSDILDFDKNRRPNPLVCQIRSCYLLKYGEWTALPSLNEDRVSAAVGKTSAGDPIVVGGRREAQVHDSVEIFADGRWQLSAKRLPKGISSACLANAEGLALPLVIAGESGGADSRDVFYFNGADNEWQLHSTLNGPGHLVSCGQIWADAASERKSVIVAGGSVHEQVATLFILNFGRNIFRTNLCLRAKCHPKFADKNISHNFVQHS